MEHRAHERRAREVPSGGRKFEGLPNLTTAICEAHGQPATATCERCGLFLCPLEVRTLEVHVFCMKCVVLPEVDYLEAYRLQFWGKRRDGYAWLFLFGGLVTGLSAVTMLLAASGKADQSVSLVLFGALLVGFAIAQLAWFFKQRWSRWLLGLTLTILAIVVLAVAGLFALPSMILPFGIAVSALLSVRSKLMFEMPVARDDLHKDWSTFHDNSIARSARMLGIAWLLFPPFGPLALVCGIIALKRVNPNSFPPVGKRGQAIFGIVSGTLGTIVMFLIIAVWLINRR